MTTCVHIIILPSRAAGAAATSCEHHRDEHDGEALEVVQLTEVYAPATDLSKYFTSD